MKRPSDFAVTVHHADHGKNHHTHLIHDHIMGELLFSEEERVQDRGGGKVNAER